MDTNTHIYTQVRLTGRLQQLLPSFLPAMLGFGAASAVDKVVVDNERHILYVLSQPNASIQVGGGWVAVYVLCVCCSRCFLMLFFVCVFCVFCLEKVQLLLWTRWW